jgi:ribosomal protein S10
MVFVTRLTFQSGDRDVLDAVVGDIAETCRRKGVEMKGPHSDTPAEYRVPMYRRLDGDPAAQYPAWQYTVFQRRLELYGHEEVAREILERDFPERIKVEAAFEGTRTPKK